MFLLKNRFFFRHVSRQRRSFFSNIHVTNMGLGKAVATAGAAAGLAAGSLWASGYDVPTFRKMIHSHARKEETQFTHIKQFVDLMEEVAKKTPIEKLDDPTLQQA